jgi:retron-type reverse transcriptase
MCLNETYSKGHVGKHLSDKFPTQNGLKQGDAPSPLLFNFALEYAIRKVREKSSRFGIEWDTSAIGLTYSMVQNIISKADCYSAYQKISLLCGT